MSPLSNSELFPLTPSIWAPDVYQAFRDFISLYGCQSQNYSEDYYAVFDFDNSTCLYDLQDHIVMEQVLSMSFAENPEDFRCSLLTGVDSKYTDWILDICDAYSVLFREMGPFSSHGLSAELQAEIQQKSAWLEFSSKMLSLALELADEINNWKNQWIAGMTDEEIYNLSHRTLQRFVSDTPEKIYFGGPKDYSSRIGAKDFSGKAGLNVPQNMYELWKLLFENGIDIWICSASESNEIRAAVDYFHLRDYCTGIIAENMAHDADGRYLPIYEKSHAAGWFVNNTGWNIGNYYTDGHSYSFDKVCSISEAIAPYYHNRGPILGCMDSTGDYNFCTEYKDMKLVLCLNRLPAQGLMEGCGLLSCLAVYQRDVLHDNLQSANQKGDTFYILQGRDENHLKTLRADNLSVRFDSGTEELFRNTLQSNRFQEFWWKGNYSPESICNQFCIQTKADSPLNPVGLSYGFIPKYHGYHQR